jgi:hypothetical protein
MAKKEQEKKKSNPEETEETPQEEEPKVVDGIPYLETNIDKLYNLVSEKKSVSFEEAAEKFDVDKAQIASWAKILEDHKLARLHYPVYGTPVIFAKEPDSDRKIFGEETAKKKKPSGKGPKLLAVIIPGVLLVFLGVIMIVNNPTTITIRSQITSLSGKILAPFNFLRYPLNIITPAAIIIAIIWIAFSARRRRRMRKADEKKELDEAEDNSNQPGEDSKGKEKPRKDKSAKGSEKKHKGNEIEDKIDRIKEKLGS